MATELFAANRATTTVSSGGTTAPARGTQETWTVASSAMFGAASTGASQFHVADPAAPSEIIAVTNVSGTTWTVTRGAESTTPVTHAAGFTVYQVTTAGFLGSLLPAVPYVTVSPLGIANGGSTIVNNGANYGPDTASTTTSGIQEALNSLLPGGGTVRLLPGTFVVNSPISLACDGSVQMIGSGVSSIENIYIGSMPAYIGTLILVTGLSAGQWAFTFTPLAYPDGNQGSLRLQGFSVRGQPYTYTGSTPGSMNGIQTNFYGPQTQTIDDVKMEYLAQAWYLQHPGGGPIVIYKVQNVFCGLGALPSAQLGAASFWCGHWEEFANQSTLASIEIVVDGQYRFDSMWTESATATFAVSDATSADHITLSIGKAYELESTMFAVGNAGTTDIVADSVRMDAGNVGLLKLIANSGTTRVDVNNLITTQGIYLFGNGFPTNYTAGSGSYVFVKSANFGAGLYANYAVPSGMLAWAAETGTTQQQTVLNGTTAGTAISYMAVASAPYKKFLVYLNGYENTTGTHQTITFPNPFAHTPAIMKDDSGGASVSSTVLTLPSSMGSTKTGYIILEGY